MRLGSGYGWQEAMFFFFCFLVYGVFSKCYFRLGRKFCILEVQRIVFFFWGQRQSCSEFQFVFERQGEFGFGQFNFGSILLGWKDIIFFLCTVIFVIFISFQIFLILRFFLKRREFRKGRLLSVFFVQNFCQGVVCFVCFRKFFFSDCYFFVLRFLSFFL